MSMKQNRKRIGRTDILDLNEDPMYCHYLKIVLVMSLILPMLAVGLGWGDWWGWFSVCWRVAYFRFPAGDILREITGSLPG